jgi:hypothetical protein
MRRLTRQLLVLGLAVNLAAGCIGVEESGGLTAVHVDPAVTPSRHVRQGPLHVASFVYRPSRWPLEEFARQLGRGHPIDALAASDLRYHAATSDDAAITALLDAGLVPVYVKVTNGSARPVPFDLACLELQDGARRLAPVAPEELPRALERVSYLAFGANVFNLTVIAVLTVVIIAAAVNPKGGGGHAPHGAIRPSGGDVFGRFGSTDDEARGRAPDDDDDDDGPSSADTAAKPEPTPAPRDLGQGPRITWPSSRVMNDVHAEVEIDYRDQLLQSGKLAPRSKRAGLVFFTLESRPKWAALRLGVTAACASHGR